MTGKRDFGLDALRAAAIVGVVLAHGLTIRLGGYDVLSSLGSGVELFFVLSGFLIGRIYFRSSAAGSLSLWRFWRSRWWRTLPPYFAAIAVYIAVGWVHTEQKLPWYYLLFLQNYLGITGFDPSWSLCIEEHFYLLLPILGVTVVSFAGKRSFQYLLPIAFVLSTLLRFGTLAASSRLPAQWYWFSHLHFDGLIAGVWLAYMFVERPEVWVRLKRPARWLLPISPLMLLSLPLWASRPNAVDMLAYMLYAIGYAAWLRYLYDLSWLPVARLGKLAKSAVVGVALSSYSVYLTHSTLDPWIRNDILGSWHRSAFKSISVLSTTYFLGVAFYFAVERPTIISRDRYLKRAKIKIAPAVRISG